MKISNKLVLIALLIILVYLYKAGYLNKWKGAALKGMAHLRKDIGSVLNLFKGEQNAR